MACTAEIPLCGQDAILKRGGIINMEYNTYTMGKLDTNSWRGNDAQQITFVVTQDCNLRCQYCYMTEKNDKNIMSFDVAKKIVDYFIDNRDELFSTEYIILDFIGGEPLLEIDLIDKIVDYFILSTYRKKSKWFGRFRLLIQSNGVLFDSPKVQHFLKKNRNLISLGITIDGTEVKHDFHRVFPNGEGSYAVVEKNYKKAFQEKYTDSTKVTFGSGDLQYLKDSIVHLWSMGLKNVPANIVFEDVWKEGDDAIYLEQLVSLADYIIDNRMWDTYNTTFFLDVIGFKALDENLMSPVCGTGRMYCVDANGNIYNCVRFMPYSLNGKESRKIGDIYHGVDMDRNRPLKMLLPKYISEKKCLDCRVSQNCTYCAGNNYDMSDNDSMFYRATAICNMFKAQVKANNYYWARLYNEHGIQRDVDFKHEYFMYFILSSDSVNYCKFKQPAVKETIRPEDLLKGLAYAYENFYQPVFVHSDDSMEWIKELLASEEYGEALSKELKRHIVRHIVKYKKNIEERDVIYVMDETTCSPETELRAPVILNVNAQEIGDLAQKVKEILPFTSRVNINIYNLDKTFDIAEYESQLKALADILFEYLSKGKKKEIRQLTDRIFVKQMNNCFAGEKNITFAPDGKFYICPAFYFDGMAQVDMEKSKQMTYLSNSPGCDNCDAYQCERCVYKNFVGTGELNTPTEMQCKVSHLERKYGRILLEKLKEHKISGFGNFDIPEVKGDDPIERLLYQNKLDAICF